MKTEKEKMLAGEIYDCGDAELLERWHVAKKLLRDFAQADTRNRAALDDILNQLLGSRGENIWIASPFFCDYGDNIHLGNNVEINANCTFLDCNEIRLGDNALIAPNVQIYTVTHPVKASERFSTQSGAPLAFCVGYTAPVIIGNNVWIGGGSIILPGVTIGNNVTIGAGSLVTRDLPDDVLAYGNPCRIIRSLREDTRTFIV